jgi:hypothetical protein
VYFVQDRATERMKEQMASKANESLSTSAKLERAIKYRLEALAPYNSIWPQVRRRR